MSLYEESVVFREKVQQLLGEKIDILTGSFETLSVSGAAQVGQFAPEFTLPDAYGTEISLAGLLSKGPVVLSFYRGEWCPFCNLELNAFQRLLPEIDAFGATLVAISPEKSDFALAIAEKNKLTFPVLSDLGNAVARAYGLVFASTPEAKALFLDTFHLDLAERNGDASWELPIPGTFVIDTQRTIRFAHVDPNYMTGRANPDTVLAVLHDIKESLLTT
jgi:peroxiredoxin